MQKKHFFLGNKIAEDRSFTPRTRSVQPPTMPERSRQEHAAYIKEIYNTAIDKAIETLSQRSESGLPVADGVYMNFDMVSGFVPQTLAKSSGASILKISEDKGDGNVDVTIYVKKEKKDWLDKKANEYANEEICDSVYASSIAYPTCSAQLDENAWITTGNVSGMTWCIPALSKNQEAAKCNVCRS